MELETRNCAFEKCIQTFKCYPSNKQMYCSRGCQEQHSPETRDKIWKEKFLKYGRYEDHALQKKKEQKEKRPETEKEMSVELKGVGTIQFTEPSKTSESDFKGSDECLTLSFAKKEESLQGDSMQPQRKESLSEKKNTEKKTESELMKTTGPVTQETNPIVLPKSKKEDIGEIQYEDSLPSLRDSGRVVLESMNSLNDSIEQMTVLVKNTNLPFTQLSASKEIRESLKVKLAIAKHIKDLNKELRNQK